MHKEKNLSARVPATCLLPQGTVKAATNATIEIWVATSIHEFEGKKHVRVKQVDGNGRDE